MRRFFVKPTVMGDTATITGAVLRHMQVLRLKPGAAVILADGEGGEWRGTIRTLDKDAAVIALEERLQSAIVERLAITLYQGLPKGDKLELVLQKGTELGAAGIVPFRATRSMTVIKADDAPGKIDRWQRIASEAARQSRRPTVPAVAFADNIAAAVKMAGDPVKLLLWEEEAGNRLKEVLARLPAPESVAVIIGPEGGLSAEEAATAREGGFIPVSLGSRILRTETAGLAILAILQFYWGDLG